MFISPTAAAAATNAVVILFHSHGCSVDFFSLLFFFLFFSFHFTTWLRGIVFVAYSVEPFAI